MACHLALALDVLYPRRCLWCGRVVGFTGEECCAEQAAALEVPAAPLALAEQHAAAEWLGEAWALYRYEGVVQNAIRRMKFGGDEALARELGLLLAALCNDGGLAAWADLLAPVPMARAERRRRGYSQTEILAATLGKHCGISLQTQALAKPHETERQASLGSAERRANVAGVFAVRGPAQVKGKRVLLVDDVITTGSTLNECAKMLLAAGAREVRALCVAATPRGTDGPEPDWTPETG